MNNNNNNNNNSNNNNSINTNNYNNNMKNISDNSILSRIRIYLFIVFIAYFFIKIIYSPFKIYPNKYNYNSLILKSCDELNITKYLNNYTPEIWNTELYDFLILIILCILLFLFKSNNEFPMHNNSYINIPLWFSFIIGLLIPPLLTFFYGSKEDLQKTYDGIGIDYVTQNVNDRMKAELNKKNTVVRIESIILIIIGIIVVIINILTNLSSGIRWYGIFICIIIGLCVLLFFTKKNKKTYTDLLFEYKDKNDLIILK